MKRIGNLWERALTDENCIRAVIEGTQYKRKNRNVRQLLYDTDKVADHPELWHMVDPEKAKAYMKPVVEELRNGTWKHQEPRHRTAFCPNKTKNGGKWRELYIPSLKDHMVAHMMMQVSKEAFTKGMHPHCCGSVPDRGIGHIVKTVERWFKTDRKCRYFVKLDIRKFFDSIDRDVLVEKLGKKIKDRKVLDVFIQIIDSAPVPCPVGYYTSPWFANLYLEDLDHFVEEQLYKERRDKRIKYVRHYLRYMDDILLVGTCKKDLEKAIQEIRAFIGVMNLKIKDSWEIKQIGKHEIVDGKWKLKKGTYWCDIGGYKFSKDATIMRDGVYLSARRLAKKMNREPYYTKHQCLSINARIGWSKHANSHGFIENEIKPYVNIKETRRKISYVDQIRKRRERKAVRLRTGGGLRHSPEELPSGGSNGGKAGALRVGRVADDEGTVRCVQGDGRKDHGAERRACGTGRDNQ